MIIHKSNGTHEFANQVDELRALPSYVLRAARVQVPEDDMDDLQWTREKDGEFKIVDPQFMLGSELLEGLGPKMLGGTIGVEVILVIGHFVPSIVKVHPVGSYLYLALVNTLPVGL
ncbi:hypothetical protein Tco_0876744 [Tanacetum coccineum]|uniref:Uncharacterized protein n=1 Tax=Tanacetum coccineum TaxID=301880 RepID=A0ABQ5BUQ1_9ASTR